MSGTVLEKEEVERKRKNVLVWISTGKGLESTDVQQKV
jgi:hypothetical protein